ncbi:hypothetical protein [Mycolicibacterium komossense]|jgi:hypothetical protein|uniref:Uncharacterized protein n=1 Tax=Mycolicibacterium komossense TaxID=1779 RepID=A0ABT3CGS8_9MYCO|nr:hypothetical protein [Mycolicibacterium komossense]MCV7228436.1 hypothetical protein [Mycolicibacterium komossense]
MFSAAMMYLLGVVVSSLAFANSTPSWLRDGNGDRASDPSAVLVAGLLWPLLLVGAAHFLTAVYLHKVEVHRTVLSPPNGV